MRPRGHAYLQSMHGPAIMSTEARPFIRLSAAAAASMGTRLADPTLQNEIVVCRPFKVEDVAPVYEAVRESLTQLSKWMIWCHHGYSIEDTLGFISKSAQEWA